MHLICFTDGTPKKEKNGKQFKLNSLRKQPKFGDATRQITSEKREQKFYTEDASLPRTG